MEWITDFMNTCNSIGGMNVLLFILCLLLIVIIFGLYKGFTSGKIFDLMAEKMHAKRISSHAEEEKKGFETRLSATPKILLELAKLINDTDADRACVLELHNGKENPLGLPFVYCDMTYEQTQSTVDSVQDEYENLNLSRYPLFDHLYTHKLFIGKVEELEKIDQRAVKRLTMDNASYIAIYALEADQTVGFLQIVYNEEKGVSEDTIRAHMLTYAQRISKLLDYRGLDKK